MDAATGLQPIANYPTVRERQPRRGSSGAFERAMEEQGESEAAAEEAESSMRSKLQPQHPPGRREDGRRHVDVLA